MRIWVHLGCSDEEKFHPQMISLDININFKSCLKGAETDNLSDAICYAQLVKEVELATKGKKFNLVEKLAKSVHDAVTIFASNHQEYIEFIEVIVHKISPPVPSIHGGVKWLHH